jgi:sulfite reductase beta subunit-like hemoprotein
MLDNIATSQLETEIQNRIVTVAKHFSAETKYVIEKTGVESFMQEDEIKEYLKVTLQEIENSKKPNK